MKVVKNVRKKKELIKTIIIKESIQKNRCSLRKIFLSDIRTRKRKGKGLRR